MAEKLKVIIWHGYLLRGTGSNIYVSCLARALVRAGHEVVVMCQDPRAAEIDFVDRVVEASARSEDYRDDGRDGCCTVVRPDIGGLLPVYVLDDYEGFEAVKTFVSLSDAEVEDYIARNVVALRKVVAGFRPDIILTNHAVCSPVIVCRANLQVPYFSYIHGSAIEYAVKRDRRFHDLAIEGLSGAARVFAGSSYQRDEVLRLFGDDMPGLSERLMLLACGVDVENFCCMADYDTARHNLSALLDHVERRHSLVPELFDELELATNNCDVAEISALAASVQRRYDYALPEAPFLEKNLDFNPGLRDRDAANIYFLGKLIPPKGFQDLLVAFSELLAAGTKATLTVTAFGKYREHFELMLRALSSGNRGLLDRVLSLDAHFEAARCYYRDRDDGYFESIRVADPHAQVFFTGRLGHEEIRNILPLMDLIVTPSRVPEAFGMVAIEGMACGVLSAVTYFSGLVDVADTAARYLDAETMDLVRLDRDDLLGDLRAKLPGLVKHAVDMTSNERLRLREIVVENFTWTSLAEQFIERASCSIAARA